MISLFQSTVKSVKIDEKKKCDLSLQVAIEMPSDIRKVYSPTHTINCKVCFLKSLCFTLIVVKILCNVYFKLYFGKLCSQKFYFCKTLYV